MLFYCTDALHSGLDGRMIEVPPVAVKENDVCVKMLAAPINPSDINRIEGFTFSPFDLVTLSSQMAVIHSPDVLVKNFL